MFYGLLLIGFIWIVGSKGNVATCQFSRKTYLVALPMFDIMTDNSDFSVAVSC
jgi:hypothetical protein